MSPSTSLPPAPELDAHHYNLSKGERTRLTWSLLSGFTVLNFAYAGLAAVLLPAQVFLVDSNPVSAQANMGMIMSVSAFVTIFVQPIFGQISDQTRHRWGRRAPWMCFGAVTGALCLLAIGHLTTVVLLLAAWILIQVFLNVFQIGMTAWLPDRVEPERRGTVSAFIGIGGQVGGAVGVIVAAWFALPNLIWWGYSLIAILVVVTALAVILLNADKDNRAMPREPFKMSAFWKGFWISPKTAPDFWWVFFARAVLILGYWGINVNQRYLLQFFYKVGDGLAADEQAAKLGSAQQVASILTLVAALAVNATMGPLSDKLGRRKPFVIVSSLVMVAAFAVMLLVPNLVGFYIGTAVLGLGFGCYMSIDMALASQVIPVREEAGKAMGMMNIAMNVPQMLAPLLASFLVVMFQTGSGDTLDTAPGYAALFIVGIVLMAIAAAMIHPVKSVK
ncbi:MAG: MFS transporter [Propionibacteriaceae bacterium]|jgi:MFS family permease|nr:MFS transporter [Propionibacteriaceae bacterium]